MKRYKKKYGFSGYGIIHPSRFQGPRDEYEDFGFEVWPSIEGEELPVYECSSDLGRWELVRVYKIIEKEGS